MTPASLIAKMVGRELRDLFPPRAQSIGDVVLDVRELQLEAASKPFSLQLRKGEIVALAGLEGQGQQKFARALIGQHQPFGGSVSINGKPFPMPAPREAGIRRLQRIGVGFVPEDRKEEGLFLGLPIALNMAMSLHAARSELSPARRYSNTIAETMANMRVKATGASAIVQSLSGGNQQKVLLGRYFAAGLEILLVEEPTRGVDVGAKSEIYRLLREFASRGGAVLALSRDTVELIGLCDRIYVIHGGTIVSEMRAEAATEHAILDAALSA
jgi:ribose transport system ATP-binding protein